MIQDQRNSKTKRSYWSRANILPKKFTPHSKSMVRNNEMVLMWHHFPTRPQQYPLNKILHLVWIINIASLRPILSQNKIHERVFWLLSLQVSWIWKLMQSTLHIERFKNVIFLTFPTGSPSSPWSSTWLLKGCMRHSKAPKKLGFRVLRLFIVLCTNP